MEISVIICTYNRSKYIYTCLSHFVSQGFNPGRFEIIIIDNNSTDNTALLCENFINENGHLNIYYIVEFNQGLSHARNRGIREAKGEIVIFIDDDAFVARDYLNNVSKWFAEYPQIEAAGGKVTPVFEEKQPQWFTSYLLPLVANVDFGTKMTKFPKSRFPVGANMLFRKSVFDKLGFFNVQLGRIGGHLLGGEEKDFFDRLGNNNVYYLPDVEVAHIVPENRMDVQYIKQQAIGIGASERIRLTDSSITKKIKSSVMEVVKFLGSLVLCFYYVLLGKSAGGFFLLRFRYWIWCGYLKGL